MASAGSRASKDSMLTIETTRSKQCNGLSTRPMWAPGSPDSGVRSQTAARKRRQLLTKKLVASAAAEAQSHGRLQKECG